MTYYQANRERIRAQQKAYRERNRKRINAKHRAWYASNAVDQRAKKAAYRQANPDVMREWVENNRSHLKVYMRKYDRQRCTQKAHTRRARVAGASGRCSTDQLLSRVAYYGGRCWMCRGKATTIDHVIPLARGGSNWPANLRPACLPCNLKKGVKKVATCV